MSFGTKFRIPRHSHPAGKPAEMITIDFMFFPIPFPGRRQTGAVFLKENYRFRRSGIIANQSVVPDHMHLRTSSSSSMAASSNLLRKPVYNHSNLILNQLSCLLFILIQRINGCGCIKIETGFLINQF